ncbi:hypothetical protein BJ170DRAFT_711138 [Xylariales sp. AK1849]|nr:hypothetical protein BJ170DRAFT_711138 [Xylariales sp. AK1849]
MTPSSWDTTVVRLAESTALLSLLDNLPEKPKTNVPNRNVHKESSRQLSFDQEREICTGLAFLAGISNDPNHVTAVGVEERDDPRSVHVMIAINKSKPGDGNKVLTEVANGFRRIFGDPKATVDEVFHEVVALCRPRILSRLRSSKATKNYVQKQRPQLLTLFRSIIEAVSDTPNVTAKRNFINEATPLLQSLQALEGPDSSPEDERLLRKLIKRIRHFLQVVNLDTTLEQLKKKKGALDPSIGAAVKGQFCKLAHYRVVSKLLHDRARMLGIFKCYEVEKICLPPGYFYKTSLDTKPNLASALCQYQITSSEKDTLIKLYQRKSNGSVAKRFAQVVGNTISSGKIHAEVQILSHCEDAGMASPTRVIASSKSACFLCNALFKLQGRYHIPDTHGKLYPGWLLPTNVQSMAGRLPEGLDNLVRAYNKTILRQLLSKSKRKRHKDPHESAIFQLPLSVSSLADSLLSVVESIKGSHKKLLVPTIMPMVSPRGNEVENLDLNDVAAINRSSASNTSTAEEQSPSAIFVEWPGKKACKANTQVLLRVGREVIRVDWCRI